MAVEPALPSRPDRRPLPLSRLSWVGVAASTALAVTAIVLFPRSGGDAPPLASLALIGAAIAGVTTPMLYAISRRDLRLPASVAVPFVVAFVLIVLVKFVLAPQGLYEVNAVRALEDAFGTVADPAGAALTAAAVFAFYALGYRLAFRFGYGDRVPGRVPVRPVDRRPTRIAPVFVGLFLIGTVLTSGGLLVLGLLLLNAPRQYLGFVFSSWAGAGIAVALLVAASVIAVVFRRVARGEPGRAPVVSAEVGAVVTLFWLGLGFLALYHVLWIVYVLVLASIWPLKTVVPK